MQTASPTSSIHLRPEPDRQAGPIAGLLLFFVAAAGYAALTRGPWLDEFWTLWQTRHDIGFAENLRQRWMADFNPPLFSLLHWLAAPLLGDSLIARRAANLLPLAWAAAFVALVLRTRPRSALVVLVFSALSLSLPALTFNFAEARSYFAQMALGFVLVAAAIGVAEGERDLDWRRDAGLAAMVATTIVLVLNLHYVTSLLAGLLVLAMALSCVISGQRRWAALLLGSAALGSLCVAMFAVAQRQFLQEGTATFWVSTGWREALRTLAGAGWQAVRANLVVALLLVVLAAGAGLEAWRALVRPAAGGVARRRLPVWLPPQRRALTVLAGTGLLFCALLLVVHGRQPIVTAKYLMMLQVLAAGFVACLVAPLVARWRVLPVLIALAGAVSIALNAAATAGEARWNASAGQVQRLLAACPSSPVFAREFSARQFSRNARTVMAWAYERQARLHGFGVQVLAPGAAALPAPASACPALLWVEHVSAGELPRDASAALAIERLGLDLPGFDVAQALVVVGHRGFVLVLPGMQAKPAPLAAS